MTSFTTVATTVAMKVTRFTAVAKTVAKKTIGLAHMHFAPSGDSCVFVRTDSAPLSDSYGLVHTGCERSIDHAAAAAAAGMRKSCVTGRHPSCAAVISPALAHTHTQTHRHAHARTHTHTSKHARTHTRARARAHARTRTQNGSLETSGRESYSTPVC